MSIKRIFGGYLLLMGLCLTIPAFALEFDGATVDVFGNIFLQSAQTKEDSKDIEANDGFFTGGVSFGKKFNFGAEVSLTIKAGSGDIRIGSNDAIANTDDNIVLSNVWYKQTFIDNVFHAKIGRIGTVGGENEVMGDNDNQFISSIFAGERSDWKPFTENSATDALGISFTFIPSDLLEFTYGYAGPTGKEPDTTGITYESFTVYDGEYPNENQKITVPVEYTIKGKNYYFDADGYNALQANLKLIEKGNYRVKVWQLNETKVPTKQTPSGFSLSFDQELFPNIKAGFRYGQVSNPSSLPYASLFNLAIKKTYSIGLQSNGSFWNRAEDFAGIALGREDYNVENTTSYGTVFEVYYKYAINEYISLSPSIQYQTYTNFFDLDDVFSYAIRTHFSF
jgi:hypothetical protein